jgi:hypothetical protein
MEELAFRHFGPNERRRHRFGGMLNAAKRDGSYIGIVSFTPLDGKSLGRPASTLAGLFIARLDSPNRNRCR